MLLHTYLEFMRPIISAERCPLSPWPNRTFIIEYIKNVVGNETIFVCQSGIEPQEKMNATSKNRGSQTENNTACSNRSEGIIIIKNIMQNIYNVIIFTNDPVMHTMYFF